MELLFDSWHSWKVCFLSGCKKFAWGGARIVTCILLGVLSILRWLWRLLIKAVGNYPTAAIIIALTACIGIWLFTYASSKARLVTAENERDTMAYRLQQYEAMYDGNTDSLIIVRKEKSDTLTFQNMKTDLQ